MILSLILHFTYLFRITFAQEGNTALSIAVRYNRFDIIVLLLARRRRLRSVVTAEVNQANNVSTNHIPLHVGYGIRLSKPIVHLWCPSQDGYTPIMIAALYPEHDVEIIKALVRAGAMLYNQVTVRAYSRWRLSKQLLIVSKSLLLFEGQRSGVYGCGSRGRPRPSIRYCFVSSSSAVDAMVLFGNGLCTLGAWTTASIIASKRGNVFESYESIEFVKAFQKVKSKVTFLVH